MRQKFAVCLLWYCYVFGVPWLIMLGSEWDDWIYWRLLLQSPLIQYILTAHSRWLPKTSCTTSVFSSVVNDLFLIYESVTSRAFVVRWLTLHIWTFNWTIEVWNCRLNSLMTEWLNSPLNYVAPFYNFKANRIEIFILDSSFLILCLTVATRHVLIS
jgi:hypothetical protein